MMIAVFNSEFSGFSIMIWLVFGWNWSSEWKPLKESANFWSFVVWVNWKTEMVVDAIIESGQLSGGCIIVKILLNFGIISMVELVINSWLWDKSSIWTVIHFVCWISKLGDVIDRFSLLAIVDKCISREIIMPSNTVMNLSACVVIIPFHRGVVLQKVLKFKQFEDTCLVWKSGGGED